MDKNNAYIGGAQVKICPHAGVLPKNPQQTHQDGTLQLNLAPGSYDLYIASPVFKSWYRRVDLRAESSETIIAVLDVVARTLIHSGHGMVGTPSPQPEPELLKVVVTDEAGAPVAYASLEGFPDPNTVADEKGELRLKLAPITYLIGVTSPGYERWEKMVEVIPHHDNFVKVVLKRMSTS